ncbi:MAG: 50S ribosomal protein L24 [candidate division KSB1 bacterium]|nr:50S ribosomal protein L24 [candidate division KSB1 bacterium]MDZ7301367.1 50S ribosomal protein L24 [candidate division KSB1 bacterium]MDZ7310748.1 50S ribosomal protein L24 [candidate division KSB1 bacterium]
MYIRKEDLVLVIAGNHRGKKGKVLKIFPERDRVIVEGVNMIKRHMRPTQRNPRGGIVEKEGPIHVSNVMLVCPKCNMPTRPNFQVRSVEGKASRSRARICKNCGEMILTAKA